jgi:hypothetical protein
MDAVMTWIAERFVIERDREKRREWWRVVASGSGGGRWRRRRRSVAMGVNN